ncbi:MAG: riboflavin biosynthesis protein RibF [Candidatus Wallbacteria bacterium]|nr:riboflavin biosynthesis protein RibF [Candidatus Wallbacteria bacterium]
MIVFNTCDFRIPEPCVLALGTFDGIHLAHQRLLRYCKRAALAKGLAFVVFSFSNIPRSFLSGDHQQKLMSEPHKSAFLEKLGVNYLIHLPFTEEFARISDQDFLRLIINRTDLKLLCAGFNFRFGYHHAGDTQTLQQAGKKHGFQVRVIPPVLWNEQVVSSTLIREKIRKGDLQQAHELLAHPYCFRVAVVKGKGLGRKIGFATANLEPEDRHIVIPGNGVYFCLASTAPGVDFQGLLSIGNCPSVVSEGPRIMEIHIPGFDGDLYGTSLLVVPLAFHREQMKLTMADLIRAISSDVAAAKVFFSTWKCSDKIAGFLAVG